MRTAAWVFPRAGRHTASASSRERTVGFALHAPTFGLPATIIASGARTLSLAHVSPAELVGASITIQNSSCASARLTVAPVASRRQASSTTTPVAAPHNNCATTVVGVHFLQHF